MIKKFSRRDLLKTLAAVAGSLGLGKLLGSSPLQGAAQEMDEYIYLPIILKSGEEVPVPPPTVEPPPTPTLGKVVHVHSEQATFWDFVTGWYGNYVNQGIVNNMVDEGLKQLTAQSTLAATWSTLLPGYAPGKAIAIKVNFNNSGVSCDDSDNIIDALIEPVNALIRGMKQIDVREEDIWIYDALRRLPNRFKSRNLYSGVRFFDQGCSEVATFANSIPNAQVNFNHPSLTPRSITDVLINASYLINIPIVKDHGISGVTLGFKNHFGTINQIIRPGEDDLHCYISPEDTHYSSSYNPLVDIYLNPHIRDKTILIVGDGLYGALSNTNVIPTRWSTFGDAAPNSLFFATDPVAVDCVMLDILDAEEGYHPQRPSADDYLKLAMSAGLGVYERGNPWGIGYAQIEYRKVEI